MTRERRDEGYYLRGAIPAAPVEPRGSAGGGVPEAPTQIQEGAGTLVTAVATVSFARPPLSTAAGIEKRCLTSPISSNARVRLPAPRPCGCGDGCPDCRTLADWRRFFRWGRRIA